jgi:hypothetical protein
MWYRRLDFIEYFAGQDQPFTSLRHTNPSLRRSGRRTPCQAFFIGCLALLGRRIPQSLCIFIASVARPLFGRTAMTRQVARRVDQSHVRECLGKIAEQAPRFGVVFFRQ